jgi:hypothetical protein
MTGCGADAAERLLMNILVQRSISAVALRKFQFHILDPAHSL